MKRNVIHDEREINQKRKITNEAFSLVMFFLIASILIQQYVFKAAPVEYLTEMVCFFGASAYILIRNLSKGTNLTPNITNKLLITNSLISGVVITSVMAFQMVKDSMLLKEKLFTLILVFIISSVGYFLSWSILRNLNQRKIKKIEAELDEDDDIE